MKVQDNLKKIDKLTNFFIYDSIIEVIEQYLKNGASDTVFLLQIDCWKTLCDTYGKKTAELTIARFSYLLTKIFHKSNTFVRVGPTAFFVYCFGHIDTMDVKRKLHALHMAIDKDGILSKCIQGTALHVGVYHIQDEQTFEELLSHVACSLTMAELKNTSFIIDSNVQSYNGNCRFPEDIPSYGLDMQDIDITYITEMMNFLFACRDLKFGVEMVLSCLCDYYHTQQIYVMEKEYDKESYAITYEWLCQDVKVENANFKRLPVSIGDNYEHVFDENRMLVCNQLIDIFKHDAFIAQRVKIRGGQAILQCALYDNTEYIGYVCMLDCHKERVWTSTEIATFSMLIKIICTGILQLRTQRIAQQIKNYDTLTNTWNLNKFSESVEERLRKKTIDYHKVLITFDIKNFKYINSEYGYTYGNAVLISIAKILKAFVDEQECYARIENDSFALLLHYQSIEQLEMRISSLRQKIERACIHNDPAVSVICLLGLYVIEDNKKTVFEMIDCANVARKSIKESQKSKFAFYNENIQRQNMREHVLSQIMHQALHREDFIIYYQPKINIHTNLCIGLEALTRWKLNKEELIQPNEFIPLFEKNGFIIELDNYVLDKACRQIRMWMDQGKTPLPIAVNISRIHLEDQNIVYQLVNICNRYRIPKHLIELEITESAFLEHEVKSIQVSRKLKKAGFILSMDDFGTGFSSLNLLSELPVDRLKLDRAFFLNESSEREKIVLSNIVKMAEQLNMQVISEGIETIQQVEFLEEIGCDIAQGFYYSRPYEINTIKERLWKPFKGGV